MLSQRSLLSAVGRFGVKTIRFAQKSHYSGVPGFCNKRLARHALHQTCFLVSRCTYSDVTSTPMPEVTNVQPEIKTHDDLYRFSIEKPDEFWSLLARSRLEWQRDFGVTRQVDVERGVFRWFSDGRLNASVNCIDRHVRQNPSKVALLWEKDDPGKHEAVTYGELLELVCKIGNVLKSCGVQRGNTVAIYLPMTPMVVASMLACARIGAIHSVIFAGFSSEALASRIIDAEAKVVITADQAVRGGKIIELKKSVDAAVAKSPSVRHVLVTRRTGTPTLMMQKWDIDLDQAVSEAASDCPPEEMDAEDFLFLLYTSGSTGKPKGVAHSTAGYLLYAAVTHKHVFDYQDGDIFGCVADVGWITGHSYVVYGPLANGATTVLFESTPVYPNPGRYWETVERLGITHFYCAPTALRLLLRFGDEWPQKYDRRSLRILGSVGEPLNHEAWHWFNDVVGENRCTLVDTWWQTETGGVLISPRPSEPDGEVIPAMPMRPVFGIEPCIIDSNGEELLGNDVSGALCIKSIWPGIARTIYGDHRRFLETYFAPYSGCFVTGDGAHRHSNGYYQITGRMDDVINVSGHRLGTAEVEDVMNEDSAVAETAVVGFPHDMKGEGIFAFVVLKEHIQDSDEEIYQHLRSLVKTSIAAYAVPEHFLIVPSLPKTRSGKIMRRILRKIVTGSHDFGDTSSLADPSAVQTIASLYKHSQSEKAAASN